MADKFGSNPWGITNDEGLLITPSYIKAYIACYCRGEYFQHNRAANLAFFSSDEFLKDHRYETIGSISRTAKLSTRWEGSTKPKAPEAPKPLRKTSSTPSNGVILVNGLKVVAHARLTQRRVLLVDANGEYWTNAVHGSTSGKIHVQSEWKEEANAQNLRNKLFREFRVLIGTDEVIHITPCHPKQVIAKQGEELLAANILIEGCWSEKTWTLWTDRNRSSMTLAIGNSRAKVCKAGFNVFPA